MIRRWLILPLVLWGCSSGKSKPVQQAKNVTATCSQACEHLANLAATLVKELQADRKEMTQAERDPGNECMKRCKTGRLITECAVAANDLFTANWCSKQTGEQIHIPDVMLLVAASNGDAAVTRELLKEGVDANYVRHGDTPLGAAIVSGHVEVARLLIAAKADVNFVAGPAKISLLQRAIIHEHPQMVSILLSAGADMTHKDEAGTGAIQNAAQHPEILNLLMKHSGE